MPKIADEDLAEILSDPEIADTVVIDGNTVTGYFFAPYESDLQMVGNSPSFRCNPSDVVGVGNGSILIHQGTSYTVIRPEEQRAGTVAFVLRLT